MGGIGYAGAFGGGLLTLVSPCSVLMLPSFFAYAFTSRRSLVGRTMIFYLGLLTTLVPMGVAASTIGSMINLHRTALITTVSVAVVVLGLVYALGITLPLPSLGRGESRDKRSILAVYLLGAGYGLAGVCSGPVLGSVLAVAALGPDPVYGGVLLAVYAAGMAFPLLVLAAIWTGAGLGARRWLRPRPVALGPVHTTVTNLIGGGLLVAIGVIMIITEGTAGLMGAVTVETQVRWEAGLLGWARHIPDLLVVLGLCAVGATVALLAARPRRRTREPDRSHHA